MIHFMSKADDTLLSALKLSEPGQSNRQNKIALEGQYRLLSQAEGKELGQLALSLLDTSIEEEQEVLEQILVSLACLVPGTLIGLHQDIVAREIFYPPEIYLGADEKTRNILIQRIVSGDGDKNHLLSALAWIGDAGVQQQFSLWRDDPPVWRNELYIPPEDYAQEAGWVLSAEGKRRDLFSQTCYTLVRVPEAETPPIEKPVTVIEVYPEHCHWCDWEMTMLFDLALSAPALDFLHLSAERLRIVRCDRCSLFTFIFMDADTGGNSIWAEENVRPDFIGRERDDYPRLPINHMMLGSKRRTPYEANWQVLEEGHSQVGGHPAWVEDAEYPKCPSCQELMPFIAQLQTDDLEDYSEGTTYAFYCELCGKATTTYQQT